MNLPEENITLLCPRRLWVSGGEAARGALSGLLPDSCVKTVIKS